MKKTNTYVWQTLLSAIRFYPVVYVYCSSNHSRFGWMLVHTRSCAPMFTDTVTILFLFSLFFIFISLKGRCIHKEGCPIICRRCVKGPNSYLLFRCWIPFVVAFPISLCLAQIKMVHLMLETVDSMVDIGRVPFIVFRHFVLQISCQFLTSKKHFFLL